MRRRTVMVLAVVVVDISTTSAHFECASTAMKNDFSMKGPAKSTWRRCHGCLGQVHGCNGALAGVCFTARHDLHDFAISSISLSMPFHHTWLLANDFIFEAPRCSVCSSASTVFCNRCGITTLAPHKRQPSSTVSSGAFEWYA